jgi:uncharacterized repeat protein (TIGR03803 family)
VVFELLPGPDLWKEVTLHDFTCRNGDGCDPYDLAMDASGNLYGATEDGGVGGCGGGCGTAYEVEHTSEGKWQEVILHDFGVNDDMAFPFGVLALDSAGNVYGIAGGGTDRDGVIYRFSRKASGHWEASIQYSFVGGKQGFGPTGGLVIDNLGNLYGVTGIGGNPNCECGVVYKLAPNAKGGWTYTVLHRFNGYDGAQPAAALTLDDNGNLYGTTAAGGTGGAGVAFEITP